MRRELLDEIVSEEEHSAILRFTFYPSRFLSAFRDHPGLGIGKSSLSTHIIKRPANFYHLLSIACLLLALAGSVSCSTYQHLVVYQSAAASIALGELPAGYPSLGPNQHPYTISPKKMLTLLEPLEYREGSLLPFSWGQPRRVFTVNQGKMLAQELSKAFDMALPQEVVAFTVADEEKPDRRTRGLTFIVGDELHLILEELRKPSYLGELQPYQQTTHRWEIIPGGGQRFYASSPEGKGTVPHWVICPLKP